MSDTSSAVQDYYPEDVAHCFGCGRLNEDGHQLKTVWEGDETVSRFVTASLQVDFLKPTPLGPELVVRGRVLEINNRKVVLEESLGTP